jgi:hypothetical protein
MSHCCYQPLVQRQNTSWVAVESSRWYSVTTLHESLLNSAVGAASQHFMSHCWIQSLVQRHNTSWATVESSNWYSVTTLHESLLLSAIGTASQHLMSHCWIQPLVQRYNTSWVTVESSHWYSVTTRHVAVFILQICTQTKQQNSPAALENVYFWQLIFHTRFLYNQPHFMWMQSINITETSAKVCANRFKTVTSIPSHTSQRISASTHMRNGEAVWPSHDGLL